MSSSRFGDPAEPQPAQIAERRDVAVGAAGEERPGRRLVEARNLTNDGKPEIVRADGVEAELREGNLELRAPATRVNRRAHVPDGVPARILLDVVEPVLVDLDAGRVDREFERGSAIVIGVDEHVNPVGRRGLVAPVQVRHDAIRAAVVRHDGHIQRDGVVGHPDLGRVTGRSAFDRLALPERRHRARRRPDGLGELAVQLNRCGFGDPDGFELERGRTVVRRGRLVGQRDGGCLNRDDQRSARGDASEADDHRALRRGRRGKG